ncbi:MAG: hypothetical protein ACU83O_06320 [Gammaproteobacteria bacterium]
MNFKYFAFCFLFFIAAILPDQSSAEEGDSLLISLLRFTGISVNPNQMRGSDSFTEGNIWLVDVGDEKVSGPRKITQDYSYHTPLWMPGSQSVIAMKKKQLVRINPRGGGELILHKLTDDTGLLGFDKDNPNRILVLKNSLPAVLSLQSGEITPVPYDKDNSDDLAVLDRLSSGFRDYGAAQVSIEELSKIDPQGHFKSFNTLRIRRDGNEISIDCPSACSQPALAENGRQLLFIEH